MSLLQCGECSARFAAGLPRCPACQSEVFSLWPPKVPLESAESHADDQTQLPEGNDVAEPETVVETLSEPQEN